MRWVLVMAIMAAAVGMSAAEGGLPACAPVVGVYEDGVWWRWYWAEITINATGDVLKCKYRAELRTAADNEACPVYIDDTRRGWLKTSERVNANGLLVCRYAGYGAPAGWRRAN